MVFDTAYTAVRLTCHEAVDVEQGHDHQRLVLGSQLICGNDVGQTGSQIPLVQGHTLQDSTNVVANIVASVHVLHDANCLIGERCSVHSVTLSCFVHEPLLVCSLHNLGGVIAYWPACAAKHGQGVSWG